MGWKGTVRSIGSAVRAAERNAKRRQRELEKKHGQFEKMQELEQASYEVEVYENEIEIIQSMHKDCSDYVDWIAIASFTKPEAPTKESTNEDFANEQLKNYKPGLIDKIFRLEASKLEKLGLNRQSSVEKDDRVYKSNIKEYEVSLKDWNDSTSLARRLMAGEAKAKIESIKELNPFLEILSMGSSVEISVNDQSQVEAIINVHGGDIVPNEVKSLLKNGKLSTKNMPKGMFNEIYQDYVCSCILRVANELFAAIPDELVVVTAVDDLLNSKTGHLEKLPIVSACISRKTLKALNMATLDPSDSMSNFIHNMSFKKTKGFMPVPRVEVDQLEYV